MRGHLSDSDISELTLLAKARHGLLEESKAEAVPLAREHLPSAKEEPTAVSLTSLTHHEGVNALARDQTLSFGPNLTVVYGPNAAGKSGYTRILKRACRARGAEEILGNVFGENSFHQPRATLVIKDCDRQREVTWKDSSNGDDALSRVSVFDSHCASVYLTEETDVAFRPLGLDLFDALSEACEDVRRGLEKERRDLELLVPRLPELHKGTTASTTVANLTALTSVDRLRELATLSEDEQERLVENRKRLQDLKAQDPVKVSRALNLRAARLEALGNHLQQTHKVVFGSRRRALLEAQDALVKAEAAVSRLNIDAFSADLLPGTGNEPWKALWEMARRFSEQSAYPDRSFPVTADDARCVLCQQGLDSQAADRLLRFEKYIQSSAQQERDQAHREYTECLTEFTEHNPRTDTTDEHLEELRLENEGLADDVAKQLDVAENEHKAVRETLNGDELLPHHGEEPDSDLAKKLELEAEKLRSRSRALLSDADPEKKNKLIKEANELEARKLLGEHIDDYIDEIERLKRLAAYEQCLKDTNTRAITNQSTKLTKRTVTDQLARSFKDELTKIGFRRIEVELEATRGKRGALYHRLKLKRAPDATLADIASEGEARAIAIAAFFAELSTATDQSSILFDDPVSSLDHDWRENVARRLVAKSKDRQVIVFTHDVVFLLALRGEAEKRGIPFHSQYIRTEHIGAGVSSPEVPWIGMKVKERLGVLRKRHQEADKVFRTQFRAKYDDEARLIYGLLREAWERALEEVMLGDVVQRYRNSIQTRQITVLSDITREDCEEFEENMTKCSRWLPGHDQAAAENVSLPDPEELEEDIEALASWRRRINKRRN